VSKTYPEFGGETVKNDKEENSKRFIPQQDSKLRSNSHELASKYKKRERRLHYKDIDGFYARLC